MRPFYIKQLQICNFGKIISERIAFSAGLNIINHNYEDEIKIATRLLIDAFRFSENTGVFVSPDTKIYGEIMLGNQEYRILREPIRIDSKKLNKRILSPEDLKCTEEKQNREELELSFFNDEINDYSSKLMKYKNADIFYHQGELARNTNKLSETDFFRRQIWEFIDGFCPIQLGGNKDLIFDIEKNGHFYMRRSDSKEHMERYLSTAEKKAYSLLSFISILKFWQEINEIHDFNHYNDPVIVSDCFSQIDEMNSLDIVFSEFTNINRQIIILNNTACTVPNVGQKIL